MSNQKSGCAIFGFLSAVATAYGVITGTIGLRVDLEALGIINSNHEQEEIIDVGNDDYYSNQGNARQGSSEETRNNDPCSNNGLPPRLRINDYGVVMDYPDQANFVRAGAGTDYSILDRIEVGRDFEVLDGPRCADNIYWWQVRSYDGTVGWTAEGNDGYYYVEPLD